MKKGKNITLLIGVACVFVVAVWQVIEFVFNNLPIIKEDSFKSYIVLDISPIVIVFLLLVIPVVLLVQNLENKTGKVLPIVSIIVNCVALFGVLFLSFTPTIPEYLIYNKLEMKDLYFTVILRFLENGGLLFVIGYAALIIGSFLSFPKNNPQKTIDDENTVLTDN